MCRALEAFLLAQMPSNAPLRLEAKAPGYVREPRKVRSTFICQKFCPQVCDAKRNGNYSKLDDLQGNGNKQQAAGLISRYIGKMYFFIFYLKVYECVYGNHTSHNLYFIRYYHGYYNTFRGVLSFFGFQTKQMAPGRRVVSSTPEAEQALTNLEILRSNKQYTGLAEQIVQAHSFIANPLHSLIEGPELVTILAQQLFPNEKALVIMLTSKKPL